MKKTSKLIASLSLSILAGWANAQTTMHQLPVPSKVKHTTSNLKLASHNENHKAQSTTYNAFCDYYNGDLNLSGQTLDYWNPPLYMNKAYTVADTGGGAGYSPFTSNAANGNCMKNVTVAFDTLWDDYTFSLLSPDPGSVMLDTIAGYFCYSNASGINDTIVFHVIGVTANGYPDPSINYANDTLILPPGAFINNIKDSVQYATIQLNPAIAIPATARRGWNFAIQMEVIGSKLDTLGVWYFSQAATCTNGDITNAYTTIGVPDGHDAAGRQVIVNSFVYGNDWFNSLTFGGTGAPVSLPDTVGTYQGRCTAGNYIWYDLLESGCTDTAYLPYQDIALMAGFTYTQTGISTINKAGISVNQNYPNPFNQTTQITYSLVNSSDVVFTVCDMTGRELVNNSYGKVAPGNHEIDLSANSFAPGVYFYTFNVNGNKVTKKMVITE